MSETATVEQPTTDPSAVTAPEPPSSAPETQSIRQHAEQFGHDKGSRARDEAGRFAKADPNATELPSPDDQKATETPAKPDESKRHRAKDVATPEDVPRIRELTAKYRSEERRRIELEARLAQYEAQHPPDQSSSAPGGPVPLPQAIQRPDVSRPALTDAEFYQQYPDATVGDFVDYRTNYRLAAHSAHQQQQTTQTEIEQFVEQTQTAHQSRIEAFAKAHPEYDQVVSAAQDVPTTPIVNWAVALHPRSPEVVLYLARHPEHALQLAIDTKGKAPDHDSVAWTQRLFDRWLQAAPTASAAAARHPIAPPPPNAVRTGPIKTGDEPPADGAGIRAHAQYYGYEKKRR